MGQIYKVFIKDKLIVFTENINNSQIGKKEMIYRYNSKKELFADFQRFIQNKKCKNLYVVRKRNVDKLFRKFISNYQIIKASGGLVTDNHHQILMIYRHDRWDLPKGKKTKREKNKMAALREVSEETGISKLQIIKKLPVTYHFYREKNTLQLKKTHWYLMKTKKNQDTEPAYAEGITRVAWFNKKELNKITKGTYRSVKEVIASAEKYMNE